MKKILLSGGLVLTLLLGGCRDFLDINTDPDNPNDIGLDSQFPVGQVYSTVALGYTTQLMGSFWSQHYTMNVSTNQYNALIDYAGITTADGYMTAQWQTTYRQTIPALRGAMKVAMEQGENYDPYVAACRIMEAFNWHILNSTFDRIAYADGQLGEENLEPKFESSEESYKVVLKLYEDILSEYTVEDLTTKAGITATAGKDMVFDWDMEAWLKFANTVYLKMLMRDFTVNQSKIQEILSGSIGLLDEASGDAKFDHFEDSDNRSNPFYEGDRRDLNTPQNLRANTAALNFLTENEDPRIASFYEADAEGGFSGGTFSGRAPSGASRPILEPTDPVYFASVAEAYFLKAEVYARLNDSAAAKTAYDAGVKAAFDRWGEDGSSFVADGGAYEFDSSASMEAMIEQIIVQKWIAATRCQAWDSWFDLNRTGYPTLGGMLEDHHGGFSDGYSRRYLYPQASSLYNKNTPAVEPLNSKLWWHK
ncbi:MAG: SusD/RagB family nutrient-binding outer membrane lipoprotein [Alistipes sp.]|jgi:hypothetical protein|nr:SusD/RagB family nutrient-binding outer membrane lipoprotein [Alistipes sp.]